MKYPGILLFSLSLYLVTDLGTRNSGFCEAFSSSVSVEASPLDISDSDSEWTILTAIANSFFNKMLECSPIAGRDVNGCLSDLAANLTLKYSDSSRTVRTVKSELSICFTTEPDSQG